MSSRGVAGEGYISLSVVCFSSRQVLQAVGRKDLSRAAAVGGSGAGGECGLEIATGASHPVAVQSPRVRPEDRRGLVPVVHPSEFLPSSPCDPGPPGGRRAHSGFALSDALVPTVYANFVNFSFRR